MSDTQASYCERVGPVDLVVYHREDGSTVVHVDTDRLPEDERGPLIAVYLNDELLWEHAALEVTA